MEGKIVMLNEMSSSGKQCTVYVGDKGPLCHNVHISRSN